MNAEFGEALIGMLPNLRRYAISLSRRADVADDLVQITVERALARQSSFDRTMPLEPWLFRILRNAYIDLTRRNRTQGTQLDVFDMPDIVSTDGEATVETRLMLRSATEAMHTLPEDQRDILHLICIEELSYAEAAEVLEIPKGTVMSRLARARLALSEKLGIK